MQQFGGSMFFGQPLGTKDENCAGAKPWNILLGMLGHTVADKIFYWILLVDISGSLVME